MAQQLPNPFEQVGQFFQGVCHAAQQHPLAKNATRALQNFQEEQRVERLPPRIVALPRHCAAIIPGDSTAELVLTNGLSNFLNLYNTALICRIVLTWFPNPPEFIATPLSTICDPYLNLFRGLLPPLGGSIDFSPILAFVVLNLFTNTAAALPAEVPSKGAVAASMEQAKWSNVSKGELAYQRRIAAQRAREQQQ